MLFQFTGLTRFFSLCLRDIRDISLKDDIEDFCGRIRECSTAIVLLSDAFLKSRWCMYEVLTLMIVGGMYATMFDDYWIVSQGIQYWADKLAEKFVSLGGTLKCKSLVEKIVTEQGKAVGVEYI